MVQVTPLRLAVVGNHVHVAKLLLGANADVNKQDRVSDASVYGCVHVYCVCAQIPGYLGDCMPVHCGSRIVHKCG